MATNAEIKTDLFDRFIHPEQTAESAVIQSTTMKRKKIVYKQNEHVCFVGQRSVSELWDRTGVHPAYGGGIRPAKTQSDGGRDRGPGRLQ